MFSPRGGSSHVVRALARELPAYGWDTTIVCGSIETPGHPGDARRFFEDLDVRVLDMTAALGAPDPLLAERPLHASYEDRPGAPDRVFAALDDATLAHQGEAWERALLAAGAADADVLHLNHLTPLNEAAARVAPATPIVGHLHGTELLMLEAIEDGPPLHWPYAERWAERMRRWAQSCERLIVLTKSQVERVERLLGVDPERCTLVPNGFDPRHFDRRPVDRLAHWRCHLGERDLEAFAQGPVLLYVGRFTAVKRLGLLIAAYERARVGFGVRAPLVLLGGFPGESEGEHPLAAVERVGARDVFLAGWHPQEALPDFYRASDVVVLPSVAEQFGQTLVEGMACGLPAIAVARHGPAEIVADGESGWLVAPDDERQLAAALLAAVRDPEERRRRGRCAHDSVRGRYAWPGLAGQVAAVYRVASRRDATAAALS